MLYANISGSVNEVNICRRAGTSVVFDGGARLI